MKYLPFAPSSIPPLFTVSILLLLCSDKVLCTQKRAISKTGNNKKTEDGKNWYDKWHPSDTVYIDGDGTHKTLADGSGAGMIHSDLQDIGSGAGPDDEDSVHGSGDRDLSHHHFVSSTTHPHSFQTTQDPDLDSELDSVHEGSGDGLIVDQTERWPQPKTSTPRPPATTPRREPPFVNQPKTTQWAPPRPDTTTPPRQQPEVLPEEKERNNVNENEGVRKSSSESPPPVSAVPTDSTIYDTKKEKATNPILRPGILAAVIGGAMVGLLAAILLVMFIVYRMRKKDEGSYALEEPKQPPSYPYAYHKAPTKEFYA